MLLFIKYSFCHYGWREVLLCYGIFILFVVQSSFLMPAPFIEKRRKFTKSIAFQTFQECLCSQDGLTYRTTKRETGEHATLNLFYPICDGASRRIIRGETFISAPFRDVMCVGTYHRIINILASAMCR